MQLNDIKSISRRRSVSFYAKIHCVIGFNPFKGQCPDTNQGHTLLDQLVLIPTRNYLVALTKMSSMSSSLIWEERTFNIECLRQIDPISTLSQQTSNYSSSSFFLTTSSTSLHSSSSSALSSASVATLSRASASSLLLVLPSRSSSAISSPVFSSSQIIPLLSTSASSYLLSYASTSPLDLILNIDASDSSIRQEHLVSVSTGQNLNPVILALLPFPYLQYIFPPPVNHCPLPCHINHTLYLVPLPLNLRDHYLQEVEGMLPPA